MQFTIGLSKPNQEEQRGDATNPRVDVEDAMAIFDTVISVNQGSLWDFLTSPEHHNVLIGSDSQGWKIPRAAVGRLKSPFTQTTMQGS
jgi:hypothetical protein